MKLNSKKITIMASIFILSGVLNSLSTSNVNLAYANKQESTSISNRLSNLQNVYFELCKVKEEKKVLNKSDIRRIVKNLPISKTSNTNWAKCDIYTNNNENLKIGYSNDKKEIIEYIAYGLNDSSSNINSIKLHYLDIKDYKNKLGLVLSTKSSDLDAILETMNVQVNNDLYKTYTKIIKNIEFNKNITKNDLLAINKSFKETSNDDENILEIITNTSEKLCVALDKNNNIETIRLLDKNENEQVVTYVKYESDADFLSAYNVKEGDVFTVISPNQQNVKSTKDTFTKVINLNI